LAGNGTEEILCSTRSKSYQYISVHAADLFPETGLSKDNREPYVVNIEVDGEMTSDRFCEAISKIIPAIDRFKPDMIFVSAGFDGFKYDRK